MLCQICQKNPATVRITEVKHQIKPPVEGAAGVIHSQGSEQHLCDACAQKHGVPHTPAKNASDVWKLLRATQNPKAGVACPDCGMTLRDFRQKGRLGCPKDYEVFGAQLKDLLERIHGATRHVGRVPLGAERAPDEAARVEPAEQSDALKRMQRMNELQRALDAAIREEAYEAAAKLRDEIRSLQSS